MHKLVTNSSVHSFQKELDSLAESGYKVIGFSNFVSGNGTAYYSALMIKCQEV